MLHYSTRIDMVLSFNSQNELQASGDSPPPLMASALQVQNGLSNENEPLAQFLQPSSSVIVTDASRFLQDCLHKSLKSLPTTHQSSLSSAHFTCAGSCHHTSFNALHNNCQCFFQLSDPKHIKHTRYFHHHSAHHNRPSSGHHTCPGFLHHRDSSSSAKLEEYLKLSSRSNSYEKSSILSKSALSSKAGSPMTSPHASPCPSPCPSLITLADRPYDRQCSPALKKKVMVTDMNRLSADSRPQQRGKSVSVYVSVC